MIDPTTLVFVQAHEQDDVRQLALQSSRWPDVDMAAALQQIAGRQTARAKLPHWAATPGLLYPPHLSMEQCSSEQTARYKARLVEGESLVDLTGGLGVDFAMMAQGCSQATYVEQKPELCELARHNLPLLGLPRARVVQADAVDHLRHMAQVDTIYVDPARRDRSGNRVYGLSDCAPDVSALAPILLDKAHTVIVKLSPMLDLRQALRQLPHVEQVHIVAVRGECKELLLVMRRGHDGQVTVHCANDEQHFGYTLGEPVAPAPVWNEVWHPSELWLYEPNAAIMKAGCHDQLAAHLGLQVIARDSHLMVSTHPVSDFPGRSFIVEGISTMSKRELKPLLQGITRANVAVRNFPLRSPELASRLKLKDGGQTYLFGTTTATGKHIIIKCSTNNA